VRAHTHARLPHLPDAPTNIPRRRNHTVTVEHPIPIQERPTMQDQRSTRTSPTL
jgi:hypothetical protein